ncbi:MAG: tetratricopeptide repeat protein [Planctomycetota bacterium]
MHEFIAGGRYERSEGQVSIADLLKQGESYVESSDIQSPELRAKLYHTLARGYDSIAMHDRCLECVGRGLDILETSVANASGIGTVHLELVHLRGVTLQELGKPQDALGVHRGVLARLNADPNAAREDILRSAIAVGLTHQQLGEYDEAERRLRDVFDEATRRYGPAHHTTRTSAANLALTLQSAGRASEAVPYAEQPYEGAASVFGYQDQRVLRSGNTLAWAYMSAGRTDDAEALLADLITLVREAYGPDSDWLPSMAHTLGVLRLNTGDYEGSVETLGSHREAAHRAHPAGSWQRGVYDGCYANGLIGVGRFEEAVPVLIGALGDFEATVRLGHHNAQQSIELLVQAYTELGRDVEASEWKAKLD